MAFSCEYFVSYSSPLQMLHWLPQFGLFFNTAPFFSYHVKSILFAKTIISVLLLKNMSPITTECSIKKALSQRNTDNFDPAVKEIKGQGRCRGTQNVRFLPTASLLPLYPLSLHPWILPFNYSAIIFVPFSLLFLLAFSITFCALFCFPSVSSLPSSRLLSFFPLCLVLFCLWNLRFTTW